MVMRETTLGPQASTSTSRLGGASRSRGVHRAAGALLVASVCLVAPLRMAHAADDDATTGMARERFKEGVSYFDKKEYDKARAAFLQAYALKHHPAVLLNLAQSELRSGHEADAATHFAQFLRESKEATDAERQSAEAGLSAAKAVAAEVTVNVDEEGATVSLDGNAQGQSPLPGALYLTPGPHTITAKKEGRETTAQITAAAGQTSSTHLRFKKAAAPAASDAEPKEETTEEEPAKAEAAATPSDQPAEPPPETSSSRRPPFFQWLTHHPAGIVGGSLTVVGVGTGVGFAIASSSAYSSADNIAEQIRNAAIADMIGTTGVCTGDVKSKLVAAGGEYSDPDKATERAASYHSACQKYQDKVDSGDKAKQVAAIGWVVATVAAAGTVAFYFLEGSDSAESGRRKPRMRTAVVPWISGSERGLFWVGEF